MYSHHTRALTYMHVWGPILFCLSFSVPPLMSCLMCLSLSHFMSLFFSLSLFLFLSLVLLLSLSRPRSLSLLFFLSLSHSLSIAFFCPPLIRLFSLSRINASARRTPNRNLSFALMFSLSPTHSFLLRSRFSLVLSRTRVLCFALLLSPRSWMSSRSQTTS